MAGFLAFAIDAMVSSGSTSRRRLYIINFLCRPHEKVKYHLVTHLFISGNVSNLAIQALKFLSLKELAIAFSTILL